MGTRETFKKRENVLKETGQATVEFALVFPIFIIMLFAIVDFGWIGYQKASFEYGYIQASWYISANDLNDFDDLEEVRASRKYESSLVADLLRRDIENSSLGINSTKLSINDAKAVLYNEKSRFNVAGHGGSTEEASGITRYMDVTANLDYEVQPLTFFGRLLFGENLSFKKDLERTRVVRRQVRSQ